jgi:hypothetical protein
MKSCPIIPPKFDVATLGFHRSKKKLPTPIGDNQLTTWWKDGEATITKKLKEKRDVLVREATNKFILEHLGASMGTLIESIGPDIINVERNSMFNGILTIELLAKSYGTLLGIAANYGIKTNEYKVQVVRKRYSPAKLTMDFAKRHEPEYLASLPDVTKAAFRELMQEKYGKFGLELHSDDESDACVVFDYWYEEIFLKGE